MYKTLHKKQGSVTVQLRFARSSVTFCAKRDSFHTVFSAPESMGKRLKNCIHGKIPKIDAVRELLTQIDPDEIREIHEQTIDIIKRNRVFREGTIGGICCSRNRWSGIVQQHKKVLFGLP